MFNSSIKKVKYLSMSKSYDKICQRGVAAKCETGKIKRGKMIEEEVRH